MVESKLVRVLDEGTDMVFMVVKFEEEDRALLFKAGWELNDNLCAIVALGNEFRGAMSTFQHPPYDITERTGELGYNSTTTGVAMVVRDHDFESIPNTIDLRR